MTWSPGDVDVGIQSLLLQVYPILLSTLLSIDRQEAGLSTYDANFALALSSSPLTIYLVVASISDLCGIHTGLYKRIKSYRLIIRTLGALVPFLRAGLSITTVLSKKAFKDSMCLHGNFAIWLQVTFLSLICSLVSPSLGNTVYLTIGFTWMITILWLVFLTRRRSQVRADVKLCSEGAPRLRVLWTWVKCAWYVPVDVGP